MHTTVHRHPGPPPVDAATAVLRRIRTGHPTHGLYETSDLMWWARVPRSTDDAPVVVFSDAEGPVAAAMLTAWGDDVALDPLVLHDASEALVSAVVDAGLALAAERGVRRVEVMADRADAVLVGQLERRGFEVVDDGADDAEGWIRAEERPAISAPPAGYRLTSRADRSTAPHHMIGRNGEQVAERLARTELYRPDLDLFVLAPDGEVAAYGLFWFDPVTMTGSVEPMRTEDAHQGRGLARHVLTSGLDRLAAAGADRIKIAWRLDNPTAAHLYRSVGFEPAKETFVLSGPTTLE